MGYVSLASAKLTPAFHLRHNRTPLPHNENPMSSLPKKMVIVNIFEPKKEIIKRAKWAGNHMILRPFEDCMTKFYTNLITPTICDTLP